MFGLAKPTATPGPRLIFTVPSLVRCRIYNPISHPMFDRIVAFDYRFLPEELSRGYPELFDKKNRMELYDLGLGATVDCVAAMSASDPEVFFDGLTEGSSQLDSLVNGALARNRSLDDAFVGQPATLVCRPVRYSISDMENLDHKLHKTVFLSIMALKVDARSLGFRTFEDYLQVEEHEFNAFTDKGGDL